MTPPIDGSKTTPVFSGGIGLNAAYKQLGVDKILVFGPTANGRVEHNGWHAGASATLGTAYSAEVEVGKEFDINKNWGLDLSAHAGHVGTLCQGKNSSTIEHYVNNNGKVDVETATAEWKPKVTTAGVKAMANYTTNNGKFTFGAGVSGQYATNNAKNVSLTTPYMDDQVPKSTTTNIINHKEGLVFSPEIKASYNAGKHISLEANGNFFGGGLTARYTF